MEPSQSIVYKVWLTGLNFSAGHALAGEICMFVCTYLYDSGYSCWFSFRLLLLKEVSNVMLSMQVFIYIVSVKNFISSF